MTHASQITLRDLGEVLPDQIPALGLMPEVGRQSLLAWLSGSLAAGLELNSLALDPDLRQGQSWWTVNPVPGGSPLDINHRAIIREAGLESLKEAGEPEHSYTLYSSGMVNLANAGYPIEDSQMAVAGEYYSQLLVDYEENIAYRQGFLHYPKIDGWWHQELDLSPLSRSDQVEIKLVRILLDNNGPIEETRVFQELYEAFPGLATPRSSLIEACLKSYADQETGQLSRWRLRANDQPSSRIQDLSEMEDMITSIGRDLGYQTRSEKTPDNLSLVIWEGSAGDTERFYISASGLLSKIVKAERKDQKKGWIILPGSRAGLVHYKMRQNPVLAEIINQNWILIKYRHLRRLHDQGGLTRDNFQDSLCLDPFTSDSPQLQLI